MGTKEAHDNFHDPNVNPCIEEGKLSSKCMKDNYYDYDKCSYYFENYRNCKKFWSAIKRVRMRNKIKPFMPGPEEREKIMQEKQRGNLVFEVK